MGNKSINTCSKKGGVLGQVCTRWTLWKPPLPVKTLTLIVQTSSSSTVCNQLSLAMSRFILACYEMRKKENKKRTINVNHTWSQNIPCNIECVCRNVSNEKTNNTVTIQAYFYLCLGSQQITNALKARKESSWRHEKKPYSSPQQSRLQPSMLVKLHDHWVKLMNYTCITADCEAQQYAYYISLCKIEIK